MFLNKLFRNKAADILLIIGLTLSCILLINISGLISKITIENESSFEYEWYGLAMLEEDEDLQQLVRVLEDVNQGNIYQATLLNINKDSTETPALTIIIANEDLKLEYIEGGYEKEETYANAVIIGETLIKKTYVKDEQRYIECNGNEFNVIGVIKNKMSGGIDNSLYILWNSLDEDIQGKFLNDGCILLDCFYFKSNEIGVVDNILYGINDNFEDSQIDIVSLDIQDWDESNYWYKSYNKVFFGIGLFFSVITCFSVSYFWLIKRKSELAIRVAFGYSRLQIFLQLFFDLLKLVIPSLILTIIIQCIYNWFGHDEIILLETLLLQVLIISIGMLVIVLLNVLYMMKKLKKMDLSMRA